VRPDRAPVPYRVVRTVLERRELLSGPHRGPPGAAGHRPEPTGKII